MEQTKKMQGLTDAEVAESRRKYGANILTPPPKTPVWKKFLEKFKDPLIIILLVAGVLSVLISCYEYWGLHDGPRVFFEPAGIFMAIVLATGLAFYFEQKADKEFALLNKINDDELVKVVRNGINMQIPRRDVVVGDIVVLATGDEIPADGTLLEAQSLTVDESSLTGEPSASKTIDPAHFDSNATYPSNYVLRGTNVMEGHGVMEVEKVGDATENGKVFVEAQIDDGTKTPLDEQLARLGTMITRISYTIGVLIILGRVLMYWLSPGFDSFLSMDFGAYFLQSIMIAVTLVVVSVPEGLPMAVTLSLAYSMRRMLKTNNLVRRLHACETMGATTVICTDKTGTLTQNRMQVIEADFFGDTDSRLIDEGVAVNSTASLDKSEAKPVPLGNPTEGALLLWLYSNGVDYEALRHQAQRIDELPFSTDRKFMATVVRSGVNGDIMLYVKGAPEIVMGLCSRIAGDEPREAIDRKLLQFQQQAMRTLGFAMAKLDSAEGVIADGKLSSEACSHLIFVGVMAIVDPVRDDVPAAIDEVLGAGIGVKIVTGDTPATAREIGRRIGLVKDSDGEESVITGPEFAALSDQELSDRVEGLKVIARARPGDKKRLVEMLQRHNHVVAVTGDGTNDAPALNAAHVGLSMGDGTSVAKEASDITIIDNSFASIGRAVMWGRSLYKNLQRFILFQCTVNLVASLVVLVGAFMGLQSPLTVTQMLWVNLIMDTFAAMALSSLPPTHDVMSEPPRDRNSFIITKCMWSNLISVGLIFFAVLIALVYVFEHAQVDSLTDLLHLQWIERHAFTPYELSLFFTIFVFLQFWNMFNVRAFNTHHSAFNLKGCGEFELIALIIVVGQVLIVEIGGEFFNVEPLKLTDWLIIIIGTSPVLWIGELIRAINKR